MRRSAGFRLGGIPLRVIVSFAATIVFVGGPLRKSGIAAEVVFSPPVNVSQTQTFSQSARLAVGPGGVLDVAWEESSARVLFSRSRDGGVTFSSPLAISPQDPYVSAGQIAMATTLDGTLHVTWTQFDEAFGGAEIVHTRSTDGTSFSPLRVVSKVDAVNSYVPSIATDGLRKLGIVWADADLSTGGAAVWFRRSANRGTTFGPRRNFAIDEWASCPDVAMVRSRNIYVVWMQGGYLDEEISFSRSTNSGRTFTAPVNISQLPEKSWCPRIAADQNGIVHVIWEEGDSVAGRKILIARSADYGASFDPPAPLSPSGTDSFCPTLSATGDGRVYATWSTGDFIAKTLQTFLSVSSDGGLTFADPLELPVIGGGAGCPEIELSEPDRVHLIWHEVPPGNTWPDIFHSVGVVSFP